MAIRINGIPTNLTEYPNSFKRQGAFPLEAYEIFNSKEEAETYARTNKIAYVGQTIKVISDDKVQSYLIIDENGTLYNEADFELIIIDGGNAEDADPNGNW